MEWHKKTGYPIVRNLKELEEAKEMGAIFVHAECPKCHKLWLSIIPNAEKVLTKGCLICTMDTEDEWEPELVVG